MRPIRLVMQAFGPYAEIQTLEMDRLGEKGIYAIIGETGTGKTTIFDAIVYALYGTGSGEDRSDGRSLRAVAARPDLETLVELEFVCSGKVYKIVRKPTQYLIGKRKKELVESKGSLKLTMPDGTVYMNPGEIDGTRDRPGIIERDVLGVTKDQFCQTVMIAQGEFRKLLRAKTDERTEILRRIFRTQRFDALSRHMDRLCKDKWTELMESRGQVSFSIRAMRTQEGTPQHDALEALKGQKAEDLLIPDAVNLAAELASMDDAALRDALENRSKAEAARDLAKQAFDRAAELQAKRQRRLALANELDRQKFHLEHARQQWTEAETRRPEITALGEQIANYRLLLPRYAELAQLEAECQRAGKALGEAETRLAQAIAREKKLKQERETLTEEAAALAGAGDRRMEAAQALRDAQERGKRLDALNQRAEKRDAAERRLRQSQTDRTTAAEKAKAAAEYLETLIREREALGNTAQTLTRLEGEAQKLCSAAEEINKIRQLLVRLQHAQTDYETALQVYNKTKADWERQDAEARQKRTLYNANIAGVWAMKLREGIPCPVCGSTHHPSPAQMAENPVGEDEASQAETQAEEARNAFNEQAKVCSAKQEARDGLHRQLSALLGELPDPEWTEETESRARKNREAQMRLDEEMKLARVADQRFQELQASEPKARQADEIAKAALHTAEAEVQTAGEILENARKEVAETAQGLMPDSWTALDLSDAISECDLLQKTRQRDVDKAKAELARISQIELRQAELTREQSAAAEQKLNAESDRSGLKVRLDERAENRNALRKNLPWAHETECRDAIAQAEKKRDEMEQAIVTSAQEVEALNRSIADTEGQLKAIDTDLTGAPEEDPEALKTEYLAKQAEYEAADRHKGAVEGRRTNNADQRNMLEAHAGKALALDHEYRIMQDVADTANGRVKGRDKVTLETYVQAAYFDRIIAYANRRLIHMSRQQYDLARQIVGEGGSKQGKTGLGLDVVDHANGQRRAVGTLSGGEGFLAALSFALGMSDAIQDHATSAVQLDAMFVDEGFGSLSDNYLGLVMDELNDTANAGHRLIGIISHVDEVKEGVERRITVTKSASGISKAEIG